MGLPQILLLIIYAGSLGMHLAYHGKCEVRTYSFWKALFNFMVIMGLLIWGGFFD